MSKGEVIDIVVLRIQNELEKYQKTKVIPADIINGIYDIEDIKNEYLTKLEPNYRDIAETLYRDYYANFGKDIKALVKQMKAEYAVTMNNLSTEHNSFRFNEIQILYRMDINPVRALYYRTREVFRRFNSEDPSHIWLYELITDREYNNIMLDAIAKDIARINKILKKYYFPIIKNTDGVPLELFHAKKIQAEFKHYYTYFESVKNWKPDE